MYVVWKTFRNYRCRSGKWRNYIFLETAYRLLTAPSVKIGHITTITQATLFITPKTLQDIRFLRSKCFLHMPLFHFPLKSSSEPRVRFSFQVKCYFASRQSTFRLNMPASFLYPASQASIYKLKLSSGSVYSELLPFTSCGKRDLFKENSQPASESQTQPHLLKRASVVSHSITCYSYYFLNVMIK